MNRESLLAQFDQLIPLAGHWAEAFEARIMREGVPLLETEMADAGRSVCASRSMSACFV